MTIFPLAPIWKLYTMPLQSLRANILYLHFFGFFVLYCFRLLFPLNGTICSSKDRCSSIGVLWNLVNKDDSKGRILKSLSILSGGIVSLLLKCR